VVQRAKEIVALLDYPKLYAAQAGQRAGFSGRQSGVDWVKAVQRGWHRWVRRQTESGPSAHE